MAEGTYEYECMRAELLGLEKPDREEWLKKQNERIEAQEEEIEEKQIEELENQNDDLKQVSGGLEELNNILSVTQKKLHRFKNVCGSLTNLLKIKVGQGGSTDSLQNGNDDQSKPPRNNQVPMDKTISIEISSPETTEKQLTSEKKELHTQRKSDLARALDNSVDKLDSMIYKAETAQYSMQHQNKQMKAFINK